MFSLSFHAGTGICDPEVYIINIKRAKEVFDIAANVGICMDILDIGGGFYGNNETEVELKEVSMKKTIYFLVTFCC